jgi:AhpD family alkylhydroperoxidase
VKIFGPPVTICGASPSLSREGSISTLKGDDMKARLNTFTAAPKAMQALLNFGAEVEKGGLEKSLGDLVKTRASQINGCALCLAMHISEARQAGESEERLYMLDAWREAPLYTDRERAALAWTEALTLIAETRAPDEVYEAAKAQFTEEELVKLTLLIGVINVWNRVNVGFRAPPMIAARAA